MYSVKLFILIFYPLILVFLGVSDLRTGTIPNKVVYPVALITIGLVLVSPEANIKSSLIGGGTASATLLLPVLAFRQTMGWGDVKMAALIGLMTGFPLVLVALTIAIAIGGIVATILLLLRIKSRKDEIPFGPFLSLGGLATLLGGGFIYDWCFQMLSRGGVRL